MKKITLLFLFVIASVFNAQAQFPQDFETAVPPAGWVSYAGTNALGTAEVWEASTTFAVSGVQSAFISYEAAGATVEDWLVTPQFTPSAATNVLTFQQRQQFTAVYNSVYTIRVSTASQTAHADFTIVDTQTEANVPLGAWGAKFVDLSAYNGVPIYVAFVMSNDDGDNWFVDDVDLISASTPPGCAANPVPADMATGVAITGTNLTFAWDVPTTGDAPTNYTFELGIVSGTYILSTTSATPTIDITGLAYNTTYYWRVTPLNAGGSATGCDEWSFTTGACPNCPANDDCDNAANIVQETNVATAGNATPTAGTIENATNSGLAAEACAGFTGTANDDVWYSFVALTDTVNITYELTGFDGVAQLYSGTCGELVVEGCADDTIATAPIVEEIQATGLTVGDTYYTRIYQYGTTATAGKTFNLKIWTSDVLAVNEFENANSFKYFPNPVKNVLTLNAQSDIQNVSIYNMLGQEVLRTAPNALASDVNMNTLQTGAYFVKVTINDAIETIRVVKQ